MDINSPAGFAANVTAEAMIAVTPDPFKVLLPVAYMLTAFLWRMFGLSVL
jgi:hypothetical protein